MGQTWGEGFAFQSSSIFRNSSSRFSLQSPRQLLVGEYDGASVSVAAVRDVFAGDDDDNAHDGGHWTPPASVPLGASRVPGELVNGTDGIGYALVPAELVRANATFLERFEDTEPVHAYRPFQPSEFIACEFVYDHLGPHDAVFNLTGETRLNASEIRARAAGTFYGDCHADCAMDAELANHVEFLGNFSWQGNCSIPVVNVTALNATAAGRREPKNALQAARETAAPDMRRR